MRGGGRREKGEEELDKRVDTQGVWITVIRSGSGFGPLANKLMRLFWQISHNLMIFYGDLGEESNIPGNEMRIMS